VRLESMVPICLVPIVGLLLCTTADIQAQRIIVEAESLRPGGQWARCPWEEGYFCASFASDFVSQQAFLAAPAQCEPSTAVGQFTVPADGQYALFARYACPYMRHCIFSVRIGQAGQPAIEREFGRLQSPKMWPFGGGVQPMASYSWGGGDNMVWEGDSVAFPLRQGTATVELTAAHQPSLAAQRQVDVLLLTPLDEEVRSRLAKWSYLPLDGLLTQSGDLMLRVTNPRGGPAPCLLNLSTIEHSPYWVHQRPWRTPLGVGLHGAIDGKPAETDYMAPGQGSPWTQIGHRVDRLNESTLIADVLYEGGPETGIDLIFEFATPRVDGSPRVIRRLRYTDESTRRIRFAIPGNVRGSERIRTAEEELEGILQYVSSLPDEGKPPELIGIRGIFTSHFTGNDTSQRVKDLVGEIQHELVGEALQKGYQVKSLGDEIHLSKAAVSPETQKAFREYLRGKGLSVDDLLTTEVLSKARADGTKDLWALVKLDYEGKAANSRVWYHSQVFGYENGSLLALKAKTDEVRKESAGEVFTGANYSPHPYYWPKESQWVRPFKLGALTMPWTEDYVWGVPQLSPQVTGYLMDVFRCAAKYHDNPIVYYVMPHSPGNTPRSFRLSYYEALAHGAKLINNYCVTPIVTAYTENYVSSHFLPMYRAVHELAYELGTFEDILFHGKVRPAQVAMLISGVTDLWDPSVNYNHERICLYYALRHAGIPVDFLTEEDIAEGRLRDYKALYISASHLLVSAAQAISDWTLQGGVIFSAAGGGLLDEYGEDNQGMRELFGLQGAAITEHDAIPDTKQTLPYLRPANGVRLTLPGQVAMAIPAIGTTQSLEPVDEAEVVGWFGDGSPAAVLNRVGQGQALIMGAFPGTAYVVPAIPTRPWDRGTTDDALCHLLPTGFDHAARNAILWAVEQAGIEPDVTLSEPIVEWSAIDSDHGTAIMLMNWTGKPVDALTVSVRGSLRGTTVASLEQGALQPVRTRGGWSVTLPLGVTDCITVRPGG